MHLCKSYLRNINKCVTGIVNRENIPVLSEVFKMSGTNNNYDQNQNKANNKSSNSTQNSQNSNNSKNSQQNSNNQNQDCSKDSYSSK